jgi:hypothetical protein
LETGNWKLEVGNWKLETGSWKLETRNWKMETGNWKTRLRVSSWYDMHNPFLIRGWRGHCFLMWGIAKGAARALTSDEQNYE